MTIHEPATLATDYAVAVLAAGCAWRLGARAVRPPSAAAAWWCSALAFTAAAGIAGGSSHGFGPNLPPAAAESLWMATLLLLNLTAAAAALSLVEELAPRRKNAWCALVAIKLAGFAAVELCRPRFVFALADYGLTLLAWLAAALVLRRAWRAPMLGALALSAAGAAVQQLRLAPASWFNHNDLYHVVQAAALLLFFQAGKRLGRNSDAPAPGQATFAA